MSFILILHNSIIQKLTVINIYYKKLEYIVGNDDKLSNNNYIYTELIKYIYFNLT
jgi:hypothetical protein